MAAVTSGVWGENKRRWLVFAGLIFLGVLIWMAGVRWHRWGCERQGLELMSSGDFPRAAEVLAASVQTYPADQRLAFLAAVACRRAGDVNRFESFLRQAGRLGLPERDSRLQRLLSRTQHGLADAEAEAELNEICLRGADDFAAEQIYEARAKGHMSRFQPAPAYQTLDYWIQWQPDAVAPRLLRIQLDGQGGDVDRAERDCRAVIASHPDNLDARIELAKILVFRRKHSEAQIHLRKAAELAPLDPRVIVGLAEIEYMSGGDLSQVEQALAKLDVNALDPTLRLSTWRLLSDIYLERKEYRQVVSLLEEAVEHGNLDEPLYHALVRAHQKLNEPSKAQHYREMHERVIQLGREAGDLNELIRLNPDDPDLRFRRGQNSLEAGNPRDAMTWWYTAILIDALHQPSHEALAKLLLSKGEVERAAQHQASAEKSVERTFERAWTEYTRENLDYVRSAIPTIAKFPQHKPDAELLTLALEVHERQRQFDPARLQAIESLVDYPRRRKHALIVLGSALFQVGRFREAEQALLEALRLDPNSIQAHRWLAAMAKDIRALDRLNQHCREWARLDPTDYRPHRLIGLEHNSLAEYGDAITAYQEALRRNPPQHTRQEVLTELADCQYESSQPDEAIKTLESAAATVARDVLLGRCHWVVHREEEAKRLVCDALRRDAQHRVGNLLRAEIAVKENEPELAAKHLELVTQTYPFDHTGWFKLSQVYALLKQRDKARECSVKAEQLKAAETQYFKTMTKAIYLPDDIAIRRELAARARQIGRPDLVEEWERAADLLQTMQAGDAGALSAAAKKSDPAKVIPLIEPKSVPRIAPDSLER